MTTFEKRGKRYYVDSQPIPSVTTILKEGFPAPALVSWAAKSTAGAAVDRWDELAELTPSQRLRILERAAWEVRDAAALRGTRIHALGEELSRTGDAASVPEDFYEPVAAYARLLTDFQVDPIAIETPVCHPGHGWAGTPDLLAWVTVDDERALWLLDIKTGKGVYADHVLQLAAYRHAELYLDSAGALAQWPRADRAGVIHVRSDAASLIPVDASERQYRTFRHAAMVAAYAREASEAWREHRPWPIGAPIEPPARVAS